MSLPFVPGIAERMEELGYDQLLRAYEDKYGKKYPPYRMEVHKEGGLAYMEELRAQFPSREMKFVKCILIWIVYRLILRRLLKPIKEM